MFLLDNQIVVRYIESTKVKIMSIKDKGYARKMKLIINGIIFMRKYVLHRPRKRIKMGRVRTE